MTNQSIPNKNVQAVLDSLDEWTCGETKLVYHSGDRMCVKIDLSKLDSVEIAGLIEWHIHHDWSLDDLEVTRRSAEMSGQAYDVE